MGKKVLTVENVDNMGEIVDKENGQIQKKDKSLLSYLVKHEIRCSIQEILAEYFTGAEAKGIDIKRKEDHSIVTQIDLLVSSRVKEIFSNRPEFSGFTFFSEEEHQELQFPAIVLDPIDGTKELVRGIPECTLSLALLTGPEMSGEGWIYNPFTSFEVDNIQAYTRPWCRRERIPLGFVSQSEWDAGLYVKDTSSPLFTLSPRGSMANKLFLMAVGACEFVITRRPKSLWDIAAGCLILKRQGAEFYQGKMRVESLDQVEYGGAPLIWVRPENRELVLEYFASEK